MALEDAFWDHVSTFQVTKYLLNSLSVLGPVVSIKNVEVNKQGCSPQGTYSYSEKSSNNLNKSHNLVFYFLISVTR